MPVQRFSIEDIDEEEKKFLKQHRKAFERLINSRKKDDIIIIDVDGLKFEVYKDIPLDKQTVIQKYKKKIHELGEDYIPQTLEEARTPFYYILAAKCVKYPYNELNFWKEYDKQSGGDVNNLIYKFVPELKKPNTN